MISITKRRLAGLASASAMVATMTVAALPAPAMAASPDCIATGFVRDSIDLTAAKVGGAVTGELDATGCDIGAYNPTSVTNADIHGARYFGIVVNGHNVNTTDSKVHQIGENPFNGTQHGRAILYINGATGAINGNRVFDFQKNGIEISGLNADGTGPSGDTTSVTVNRNVVTGEGGVAYIAQNGIVIRNGANATVNDNAVRDIWYVGEADAQATGLLNYNAGSVNATGNTFVETQVAIDGAVRSDVLGRSTTTVRPHGVRVDLFSQAKPAPQAELGARLRWKVTVDGKLAFSTRQGFDDHDIFRQHFADGSGRHVVKVFKNDVQVRRVVARF